MDDKDDLTYVDKYGNAVMWDEYGNDIYTDRDTLSVNYGHQYYVNNNGQPVYN